MGDQNKTTSTIESIKYTIAKLEKARSILNKIKTVKANNKQEY